MREVWTAVGQWLMKGPVGLLGPGNDLGVGYEEYVLLQKSTELSV